MKRPAADIDSIRQMFDWGDPNRYEWAIHGRGPQISKSGYLLGPAIGPGLIIPVLSYVVAALFTLYVTFIFGIVLSTLGIERYGGAERLVKLVAEPFKFWLGMIITVGLMVWTARLFWQMWLGPEKKKVQAQSNLHELLTTSVGLIAFVMSNLTAAGFRGSIESLGQWVRFFFQEGIRVILLDTPDVFDLRLSNIEPSSWYGRLGLVFFRFLIASGLISSVWIFYQRRFQEEVFTGTVKDCFWKCQNLLDRDTLQLRRQGRIDRLVRPESAVAMVDFLDALDEQDYREGCVGGQRPSKSSH